MICKNFEIDNMSIKIYISIFEENTSTQRSSEIHEVKVFDRTSIQFLR